MLLILKRINENVRVPDIEVFLQPALMGGLFKKAGQIESIKIQKFHQIDSEKSEYHALVSVAPDSAAKRVIKTLNRKSCNGKPINVSEYFFRHYSNDPRQRDAGPPDDRRKGDRRRKNLEIKDITNTIPRTFTEPLKEINWY